MGRRELGMTGSYRCLVPPTHCPSSKTVKLMVLLPTVRVRIGGFERPKICARERNIWGSDDEGMVWLDDDGAPIPADELALELLIGLVGESRPVDKDDA